MPEFADSAAWLKAVPESRQMSMIHGRSGVRDIYPSLNRKMPCSLHSTSFPATDAAILLRKTNTQHRVLRETSLSFTPHPAYIRKLELLCSTGIWRSTLVGASPLFRCRRICRVGLGVSYWMHGT